MTKSLHSDRYAVLLAKLAEVRAQRGMTQTQLAEALGKPQSYISKIERGERRIDVIELSDWAAALGADLESLLSYLMSR